MTTPPRNPYVAGRAISSARGFWGRADVFRVVQEELAHPERNAVVLFGQRRIGKTSILLNLRSRLPSPQLATVYFDLMDHARQPLNEVLFEIARAIAHELNLPQPARAEFERDPTIFRQHFLSHVYETLGPDRRLVLLFDEFDVLDAHQQELLPENSAARAFFPYLRETMTREPRLGFVVVVGRKSGELSTDFKSTFKAARYVRVSVLDDEGARELILTAQRDGSLQFDERAIERILSLTAGHPYFTQLMCQLVFERAYRAPSANAGVPQVTPGDVDATVPQALEAGENIFEWIWDGLPPAERVIFSAIASDTAEGAVVTEERLLATLQDSGMRILVRELELAPRTLIEWGMLKEVSGGYTFFIELMRRWVATRKPLAKVKDELDRINPLADTLFQGANGYYRRGDYEDAIAQLRQALSVNPNHLKARLLLGEVYREQGKLDDMVRELEEAYRIDPDAGRVAYESALLRRAESLEREGSTLDALKDYERAMAISPNNRTAQGRRDAILAEQREREAEEYTNAGRWPEAAVVYQQLLTLDPNNSLWRDGLERVSREQTTVQRYTDGLQAMQRQDWVAAQRAFADVVYAQPDYSQVGQLSAATLLAEATQRVKIGQRGAALADAAPERQAAIGDQASPANSSKVLQRIWLLAPLVVGAVILAVVVLPRLFGPMRSMPTPTSAPAATDTSSANSSIEPERVIAPSSAIITLTKQNELYRQGPIRAVAFSPNGALVAIGTGSDAGSLWRPDLNKNAYLNPTGASFDVTFSSDGKSLKVGDSSNVAMYDVSASTLEDGTANAPLLRICEGVSDHITAIAYDQDSSTLVASSEDGSLHVLDATDCADKTPTNFKQEVIGGQTLRDVAFVDGGERVVAGGTGQTNIWSVIGTPIADTPDQPFAIAVDGNSDIIALGTHSLILRDHDLDEIRKTGVGGDSHALAFNKDGSMLAAGYHDGKIRIWRPSSLTLLAEIEAHDGKVTGLAFSPDGTQLVSGGEDKIAKLWSVTK